MVKYTIDLIRTLRREGYSWREIATALGVPHPNPYTKYKRWYRRQNIFKKLWVKIRG